MVKLLYVEDADDIRQEIAYQLKLLSYQVIEATNGQDAIEKFKLFKPDLVFMDITMPVLDGITACSTITSEFPRAKIILLNSMIDPDISQLMMQSALKKGAKDFINKPVKVQEIDIMVKKYLSPLTKLINALLRVGAHPS